MKCSKTETCTNDCQVYWQCPDKTCRHEVAACPDCGGNDEAMTMMRAHIDQTHRHRDAA